MNPKAIIRIPERPPIMHGHCVERVLPAGHPLSDPGETQTFWRPAGVSRVYRLDENSHPIWIVGYRLECLPVNTRDWRKLLTVREPDRLLPVIRDQHRLQMDGLA